MKIRLIVIHLWFLPTVWWDIYHFALHFGDLRYNTHKPKYSKMNFQDVTTGNNDRGEKRVFLVGYVTYHCYPGRCMCRVEQGVSQSVTHCDWVGCILSPQSYFLSQKCCICWHWAAGSFVSPRCLVKLTSADWSVQFREIWFKQTNQWVINSICISGLNESHTGLFSFQPVLITMSKIHRGHTLLS